MTTDEKKKSFILIDKTTIFAILIGSWGTAISLIVLNIPNFGYSGALSYSMGISIFLGLFWTFKRKSKKQIEEDFLHE